MPLNSVNRLNVFGADVVKQLIQWNSLEHGSTQDLSHFIEACRKVEPFFDDGHEPVDRDCDADWGLDRILRCAEADFDTKMLLYPFETQLDLPPISFMT